ncbi:unnamed protein product [Eruca vesicaria subsp. sativa]|uniref:DCD domain-containing protein n=1 Tax=Eruca vesicaria subsp. sativa TaxID=29727 RepID=A0ABC8JMM8_ERUVS|nr:unnamed protein product [Eruca vesicaria subsp. sativa]
MAAQWRSSNFSCRNLTKTQLGGVVFGCTKHTINECLSKHLFGLPFEHFSYVQKIDTALPLFLFNYSDRKLHGIFEAAGPGQLNIDPYAWTSNGSHRTSFPSQVQITPRLHCQPLSEDKFKPAILDNYYTSSHHFWFELDHLQTNKLICLLTSFALKPKPPSHNTHLFHFPPSPEIRDNMDEEVKLGISKSEPVEVSLISHSTAPPLLSEYLPDVHNSQQMIKDCVLEEPKDLALIHAEHPDNTLMETVDQANIPSSSKNLTDIHTLDQETCSAGKGDGGSLVSSPRQHTVIQQLMHEVKELRAYGIENSTKICYLEEKLVVWIFIRPTGFLFAFVNVGYDKRPQVELERKVYSTQLS